jgi:hypothetical protein
MHLPSYKKIGFIYLTILIAVKYFKLPTIQFYTSSFFAPVLYPNSDLRQLLSQSFPSCLSQRLSVKVTERIAAITTCCLSPLTRRHCAYGTLNCRPVTGMRPSFDILRDYHRRAGEKKERYPVPRNAGRRCRLSRDMHS